MQKYIDEIKEIAYDYHRPLTDKNITKWINQFEEEDREFILREMVHILKKTYISEKNARRKLLRAVEILCIYYRFKNMTEFFKNVTFLNCQENYKSQHHLLTLLDEEVKKEYKVNISINDTNKKNWFYIDDNLSTGGTFFRNIKEQIDSYGFNKFKEDKVQIISVFFFLHTFGRNNIRFRLNRVYQETITNNIFFHQFFSIENNPRINNSIFNCVYVKDKKNKRAHAYLNSLPTNLGYDSMSNKEYAFRPNNKPFKENFFTSSSIRDRFEKIILEKGLDILDTVKSCRPSTRPLGFTTPSHQTLGLGSHVFTWRNTSNTCPLIYWWGSNDWSPLFPVQNRG